MYANKQIYPQMQNLLMLEIQTSNLSFLDVIVCIWLIQKDPWDHRPIELVRNMDFFFDGNFLYFDKTPKTEKFQQKIAKILAGQGQGGEICFLAGNLGFSNEKLKFLKESRHLPWNVLFHWEPRFSIKKYFDGKFHNQL